MFLLNQSWNMVPDFAVHTRLKFEAEKDNFDGITKRSKQQKSPFAQNGFYSKVSTERK